MLIPHVCYECMPTYTYETLRFPGLNSPLGYANAKGGDYRFKPILRSFYEAFRRDKATLIQVERLDYNYLIYTSYSHFCKSWEHLGFNRSVLEASELFKADFSVLTASTAHLSEIKKPQGVSYIVETSKV